MTIIPIVIGAFGTVTKGLLKELEDLEVGWRVETIQTTILLRTAGILRRVLETWGDPSEKPSANADMNSSNELIIIMRYKLITKYPTNPGQRLDLNVH